MLGLLALQADRRATLAAIDGTERMVTAEHTPVSRADIDAKEPTARGFNEVVGWR